MTATDKTHRSTLVVEDARVLSVARFAGDQFVLRLDSPKCAARATAGSFIHLQCDQTIPMRRPLSIMRADAENGWIEILFKVVGEGLRSLGHKRVGNTMSLIGPIGCGFNASPERPRPLLIGGGVGIPPVVFLAETLTRDAFHWQPLVIMGSEIPFPFERAETSIDCNWIGEEISATMPLLEDWGVPAKLASLSDFGGTYRGYVTEVADRYLSSLTDTELMETEVFSCGPTAMLEAVTILAQQYGLRCQVSLEEYMACAVGGCAGCNVKVQTKEGPAMKRVCVDGPVFEAASVFAADRPGIQS